MKVLLITILLALVATTIFMCVLRKMTRKCAPLALACAIVLTVFIAPTFAAQAIGTVLLVAMCFLALSE